jgi:hypothetical protein
VPNAWHRFLAGLHLLTDLTRTAPQTVFCTGVLIGSTPPFRSQKKFYEQEAREKHEVRETQEEEKRVLEKRLEETTK